MLSSGGRVSRVLPLALLGGTALWQSGCSDYRLRRGEPRLELSAEAYDFGEVVVGYQRTLAIGLSNTGRGDLELTDWSLADDASDDFEPFDPARLTVAPGDSLDLEVRYQPSGPGADFGTVVFQSNDGARPQVALSLSGMGTEPLLELEPETLWFGDVVVGDTQTRELTLSARGSGTLSVQGLDFDESDANAVFAVDDPPDGLPLSLDAGSAVTLAVYFSPTDSTPWDTTLRVSSNDPTTPEATVRLLGNVVDDPTDNAPPEVEILDPDAGTWHLAGDTVTVVATTWDEEDDPDQLVALLYADEAYLQTAVPTAAGEVSIETSALPPGTSSLTLRVLDTGGERGEDTVEVEVFDPDDPLPYILSGGSSLYDYWSVDDDVELQIDGVTVFSDTNKTADSHPPQELEAARGAELRIIATDENYCMQSMDPLLLHFGVGHVQELTDGWCRSACSEDACYDSEFEGPWPNEFLDETFVIEIP